MQASPLGPGTGPLSALLRTNEVLRGEASNLRVFRCPSMSIVSVLSDVSSLVDGSIQVGELSAVFVWVHNQDDLEHEDGRRSRASTAPKS